jgi:hypothetical protein
MKPELRETIVNLGIEYGLMTQFTSFVAVEEMIVTDGGQPRRIDVPVEVPEGVNRGMVAGEGEVSQASYGRNVSSLMMLRPGVVNASTISETVTVTAGAPTIDQSSSSVSTVIEGGIVDSTAVYKTAPARSTRGGSKARGGGGGLGTGAAGSVGGFAITPEAAAPSKEELKRRELTTKLNPTLLALVERLKKNGASAGADEAKFVRNGKAELQIWLTDKSEETLAKLKELGFEVVLDPKTAKLVIGRLPIEKLEALAELKFVRYVAPQFLKN